MYLGKVSAMTPCPYFFQEPVRLEMLLGCLAAARKDQHLPQHFERYGGR